MLPYERYCSEREYIMDLTRTMGECCPRIGDAESFEVIADLVSEGDLVETPSTDPTRRRFVLA